MKDYQASVEKLRNDAAEAALISDLATDTAKREIFNRLHDHLNRLADEVESNEQSDSVRTAWREACPSATKTPKPMKL